MAEDIDADAARTFWEFPADGEFRAAGALQLTVEFFVGQQGEDLRVGGPVCVQRKTKAIK